MEKGKSWYISPCLIVDDVETTANFYRDTLGFQYQRIWEAGPRRFCIVTRSGISIMLKQIPAKGKMSPNHRADPEEENWDAYIKIDDADALYKQFIQKRCKDHATNLQPRIWMSRFRNGRL